MKLKGLVILFALFCISQAVQGPSDYFRDSDKANFKKVFSTSKAVHGLKNTFYTVSALKALNLEVADKAKHCEAAKASVTEISDIFYATSIQEALGCGAAANDKLVSDLKDALKTENFNKLYFGLSTALTLRANKHLDGFDSDIKAGLKKIVKLAEDDGTFKTTMKSEEGSVLNSGYAMNLLARAVTDMKLSADESEDLVNVLNNAQDVFTSFGDETETTLKLVEGKASSIKLTGAVFRGFLKLASALKETPMNPDHEKILAITQYLISQKESVSNVEDAYFLLEGLLAASQSNLGTPVVVSLQQGSVSAKDTTVSLKATTLFGEAVSGKMMVVSAYPVGESSKAVISNQEIAVDGSSYNLNFLASKPEPGFYTLEVRFTPSGKNQIDAVFDRSLKVLTTVSVAEASIVVTDAIDNPEGRRYNVEFPKAADEVVQVEQGQHLFFDFKVKNQAGKTLAVQQTFLKISNGKKEVIVPAKSTGKFLQAHLSSTDLLTEFYGQSGDYELHLIVGDSFVQNPTNWKLGTVALKFNTEMQEPEDPFKPKKAFDHVFRIPEKRADAAMASIFTLASLAPLLLLVVGLLSVGANLKNFPTGGSFIFAVGFQATFGAILALYCIYWLSLTMVDTLKYLGILMVPYLYFASKTLNHMAAASQKVHKD